ncbi:MAG: hypothetical protein ACFCAD_18835 [Pleurocapsa sp.]
MKNTRLLFLTATTIVGTVLSTTAAQAFDFSFASHNSGAGTFSYDLTLGAGETFSPGDSIALTGLSGVAVANSSSDFTITGSDSVSSNFQPNTVLSGANTFTNAITLTSNDSLEIINYSGNSSLGSFSGTTSPVAVPFEPSANLGIFTLLG